MIGEQSIERVHPDVQTAHLAALAAIAEREAAEQAITTARAELARIKAAFLAAPTPEGDEACERAEQAVRSCERFAEAMFSRLNAAEKTLTDAERSAAMGDLIRAGEQREQQRHELRDHMHELRSLHLLASQRVALIESLLSRDASVCETANTAARAAGVAGNAKPIDPDLVRLAFSCWLAGNRARPNHHLGVGAAAPMMSVLAELSRATLSSSERGSILRLAVDELARATSAHVGDWFTPRYAPPHILAGTPAANRHRLAQGLLAALLQNGEI